MSPQAALLPSLPAPFTTDLAARLMACGEPALGGMPERHIFDYRAEVGIDRGDVPELLILARTCVTIDDLPPDAPDSIWHAYIHAWRALAQLKAIEAAVLMADIVDELEDLDLDWYMEEFPQVLAHLGPPAFDLAAAFLADSAHPLYPRVCFGHALQEMARLHPDQRRRVIDALMAELAGFGINDPQLTAFLISYLLDLKAKEAAGLMERAYAADRVDEQIVGNWATVRAELGVEGMGLVSEEKSNRRIHHWFEPSAVRTGDLAGHAHDLNRSKKTYKSRKPAKIKAQKQARKRARKKRRK